MTARLSCTRSSSQLTRTTIRVSWMLDYQVHLYTFYKQSLRSASQQYKNNIHRNFVFIEIRNRWSNMNKVGYEIERVLG